VSRSTGRKLLMQGESGARENEAALQTLSPAEAAR